jgi:hypothetical protein
MNCSSEGVICRMLPYFRKNLFNIWQAIVNGLLQHCFQQWQKHRTYCLTSGVYFEGMTATCNKYKHVFNNSLCPGSVGYSFVNAMTLRPWKEAPWMFGVAVLKVLTAYCCIPVWSVSLIQNLFLLKIIALLLPTDLCEENDWRQIQGESCGGGQSMLLSFMTSEMHISGSVN